LALEDYDFPFQASVPNKTFTYSPFTFGLFFWGGYYFSELFPKVISKSFYVEQVSEISTKEHGVKFLQCHPIIRSQKNASLRN